MAPRPKNPKRPSTISKDDWDRMGLSQKIRALDSEGIKAGAKRMSGIAGRSIHAEKSGKRASEFKGVMEKGGKFAKSLNDPKVRAELGGRSIMDYNKKQLSTGRRVGGKMVLQAGAEAKLSDLRRTIAEAMEYLGKDLVKKAARKAK
jgi:hypothetical protein